MFLKVLSWAHISSIFYLFLNYCGNGLSKYLNVCGSTMLCVFSLLYVGTVFYRDFEKQKKSLITCERGLGITITAAVFCFWSLHPFALY